MYRVVHDILPMNERLHRINRSPTEACRHCGKTDTIGHRLTECGEGSWLWNWTKRRIATMLRTIPDRIPDEWLTHPQFKIWPPPQTAPCSALDAGEADCLPYPTEPGSNAARFPGFLATDQMEALPGGTREGECRELSHCNRR